MMTHRRTITGSASLAILLTTVPPIARADGPNSEFKPDLRQHAERAIHQGLEFLKAAQQRNGGWPGPSIDDGDPAITALVAKCFLQHPDYGPNHAIVTRSVDLILRHQNKDGGIEVPGFGLRNYYTSVCLMLLAAAGDEHAPAVAAAQKFLAGLQWDESEKIDTDNSWYGGAGYGSNKRPDLSNTQLMLEALHQSGLPADDPVFQKALKFIERCQMSSESNDQPFARQAEQGGFIYSPHNGGESKAGTVTIKGRPQLRSYGSMTYAGFKSMLYADVDRKDPRIQNAISWIRRHYTLDENPNMPGRQSLEGLYYYYHTFARAMHAWAEPTLVDEAGTPHPWRVELCKKLISLQNNDGSWVNETGRWEESNPHYVTALAILAIQTALQ
jgi:squalene-hopene/tetraprenyl-beta-curcumene cyclase